jgi:hypothetical protein
MSRELLAFICAVCLAAGVGASPGARVEATEDGGGGASQTERRRPLPPVTDGGFEVDVLVEGRTVEEYFSRGRLYVEAWEGSEYELRIRNPLPVRVAVSLSVDGLNTIDARRSSSWDASKWVIEPYQTIRIGGWQMSTERARKFYFTTEREAYATRLGRKSDLGIITAVFYREAGSQPVPITPRPYPMPEPRGGADGRRKSDRDMSSENEAVRTQRGEGKTAASPSWRDDEYAATGIGRSVANQVRWVRLNLERRPAAEVTLRYEYREALVKLGVLPRPRPDDNALRRRERARGFEDPSFCPEP